jgi:hypothetical protein
MKHIVFIFILVAIIIPSAHSQTNNRLWGGLEIGGGISLADKGKMYNITYGDSKMTTGTIRAIIGYYITPQISIGGGIGQSGYLDPALRTPPPCGNYRSAALSTLPLCLDFRFHPIQDNLKLVLNANVGYSLLTNESDLNSKFMTDIAVGYKIANIGKISIVPAIGYNYNNYSIDNVYEKSNQSKHSVFLKIGIFY